MTTASTICRYLLGLMFTIFGTNGFVHFIKFPPPATDAGVRFAAVTGETHFMTLVFALEAICGVLLLADYLAPLAIVILAAILTNILLFHITMDPPGSAPALLATVLWFVTALNYRENFYGIFARKAAAATIRR